MKKVEKLYEPIYERQPRETDKSWAAFKAYRNMDASERSLRRLVVEHYGKERGTKEFRYRLRAVGNLSSRWRWRERVEAWDAYLDEVDRRERERAIREMNERHVRMARALIRAAADGLRELDPSKLSPTEIRQYFNDGARLERLAMGEPEAVTREDGIQTVEVVWGIRRSEDEE